jgi:hypothetical protein
MQALRDLPKFVRLIERGQFDAKSMVGRVFSSDRDEGRPPGRRRPFSHHFGNRLRLAAEIFRKQSICV